VVTKDQNKFLKHDCKNKRKNYQAYRLYNNWFFLSIFLASNEKQLT